VARNRVKRRVREWFRHARPALPPGSDWVVIARPGAAGLDAPATARELAELAAR
jgi:ribonuclease P protein component